MFKKMFCFAADTGAGTGGGGFDASALTGETAASAAPASAATDNNAAAAAAASSTAAAPAPAAAASAASASSAASAASPVDAQGNLLPNWRELLPPELRTEKTLDNFKDIRGLASALVSTKKLVGHNTVPLPNEHSSEQEWADFYAKTGRPAKPEDYQFERDNRIPEAFRDSKEMQEFKQTFHDLGLSPKQVAGLVKKYDEQMVATLGNVQEQAKQQASANIAALKTEWGDKYDANVNMAVKALNVLDPQQELAKHIPPGNPAIIKLLAKVAPLIGGDAMIRGNAAGGIDSIEAELASIRNNPAFMNEMNPDHARVVARQNMLMQQRAQMLAQR